MSPSRGAGSGGGPTEEELAALLAALRGRMAGGPVGGADPYADLAGDLAGDLGVDPDPIRSALTTWRRRRLAALGQTPRRVLRSSTPA
jgi:hypothetical protein